MFGFGHKTLTARLGILEADRRFDHDDLNRVRQEVRAFREDLDRLVRALGYERVEEPQRIRYQKSYLDEMKRFVSTTVADPASVVVVPELDQFLGDCAQEARPHRRAASKPKRRHARS